MREQRGPCAHCGEPIPLFRRLGVKFCSTKCYKAATYNRARYRDYNRRKLYGITQAEFDQTLASQGGVCAICKIANWPSLEGKDGPHADHDHKTGRFRGVLCQPCNHGLGKFQDDPNRLRMAADYLERTLEDPNVHS